MFKTTYTVTLLTPFSPTAQGESLEGLLRDLDNMDIAGSVKADESVPIDPWEAYQTLFEIGEDAELHSDIVEAAFPVGTVVYWKDPDEGIGSGRFRVEENCGDFARCIGVGDNKSELEAPYHELTPEVYVESYEACPYCNSSNIELEGGPEKDERGYLAQQVQCNACDMDFYEYKKPVEKKEQWALYMEFKHGDDCQSLYDSYEEALDTLIDHIVGEDAWIDYLTKPLPDFANGPMTTEQKMEIVEAYYEDYHMHSECYRLNKL